MPPRVAALMVVAALLAAAASAAVAPEASAKVFPLNKALTADVGKALASPGVVVVTTWELDPAADVDKWVATRNAVAAAAKKAGVNISLVYYKGDEPDASKEKPNENYAGAGSITVTPTPKDYAAWRAFSAKDAAYAAGNKAVKSVSRAINVELD